MLPKRILHVVGIMDRGGAETLIMNLYRSIDRQLIQFDFLCVLPQKGDYEDEIIRLGGHVYHLLPASHAKWFGLHYFGKIFRYRNFFRQHQDFTVVHFHNSHAVSILFQLLGASLGRVRHRIVHSHNTRAQLPFLHMVIRPWLRFFRFEKLACSADAGRWLFGETEQNVSVIKNGIPSDKFAFNQEDRECIRQELGLNGKKVIIHVGRFNQQKNHKFLLKIFSEIAIRTSSAHLLLIGDGELKDEIIASIQALRLSDRVTLAGIRSDIPALLSASDLLIFPSLYEGLSVALVEAQANGIGILATSNLAKETVFTPCVKCLSLATPASRWAEEALRMLDEGRHATPGDQVKAAGFDIASTAATLTRLYLSLK